MSNETKNENKPAPKVEPAADKPKTIGVKSLTFFQPHPDFDARMSIKAEPMANKGRVAIDFVPSMRLHRVERQKHGGLAVVTMVHEGHVAGWEPLG